MNRLDGSRLSAHRLLAPILGAALLAAGCVGGLPRGRLRPARSDAPQPRLPHAEHNAVVDLWAEALAVRPWAAALRVWGLARVTVMIVLFFAPIDEARVSSQFSAGYVLVSVAHVAAGVYLIRGSRGERRPGRPG